MENAKKICEEMIIQRDWVIDKYDDVEYNSISGTTHDNRSYVIFFLDSPKLNIANIKDCIKILRENTINHCIIVYNNNITSSANRVLTYAVDVTLELFAVKDLQTNITKHYYVPKHTMLNEQDEIDFKQKMGTDIPVLHKSDKVCRFYNFPKSAIIRVDRLDGSIGYRIVK